MQRRFANIVGESRCYTHTISPLFPLHAPKSVLQFETPFIKLWDDWNVYSQNSGNKDEQLLTGITKQLLMVPYSLAIFRCSL